MVAGLMSIAGGSPAPMRCSMRPRLPRPRSPTCCGRSRVPVRDGLHHRSKVANAAGSRPQKGDDEAALPVRSVRLARLADGRRNTGDCVAQLPATDFSSLTAAFFRSEAFAAHVLAARLCSAKADHVVSRTYDSGGTRRLLQIPRYRLLCLQPSVDGVQRRRARRGSVARDQRRDSLAAARKRLPTTVRSCGTQATPVSHIGFAERHVSRGCRKNRRRLDWDLLRTVKTVLLATQAHCW